jgi:ABC-type iron transport system FetAB ATPase subunit
VLKIDHLAVGGLPPLSFAVPDGECLAVEGPSGSGKTRLLRAIADLDPAGGHVFLEGVERSEMSGPEWRRRVRFVAAEPAWWAPTAREHFTGAARIGRLLASLGLDEDHLDEPLARLSTGERQRLALARAVEDEPAVLLLDEPTSALDAASEALAEELIKFQLLAGRHVLLVSHHPEQIERLAHARLLLGDDHAAARAPSLAI